MATIPGVSDGELIRTTWGDAVADELNNECIKRDGTRAMTGQLTLAAAPVANEHAANRLYVDTGDAALNTFVTAVAGARVNKAGDTMTGSLAVGNTPTATDDGVLARPDGLVYSTVTTGASPTSLANVVLQRTGPQAEQATGRYVEFRRRSVADVIGSIAVATGTTVNYNTSSDYRLKNVMGDVADALGRVLALTPRALEFKTDPGLEFDGFLAHEVDEVAPYAVTGVKDAMLSNGRIDAQQLDVSKLVPLLVGAVQHLAARVAELEAAG